MQNTETRPIGIVASGVFALLAAATALLTAQPAAAATYKVTSTQCEGAGSITEAMDWANSNPGEDTITFSPGLQVEARRCLQAYSGRGDNYFIVNATESVVFEGNGARLVGAVAWVTSGGLITPIGPSADCPRDSKTDLILATTPGFIKVGTPNQDNSLITVTVRDLDMFELNSVARIEKNASLILEDANLDRIIAGYFDCDAVAVEAQEGANFTARRTVWDEFWNNNKPPAPTLTLGAIVGRSAGNLAIEDSMFRNIYRGAVRWIGQTGAEVNIVTSQFDLAGGIHVEGDAESNIVNSIVSSSTTGNVSYSDYILNTSSQDMNIQASTVLFPSVECDLGCRDFGVGFIATQVGKGKINFIQSAIGVNFPDTLPTPSIELLDRNSAFTADGFTWIQPTAVQDAVALKGLTGQQDLLTEPPALRTEGLFSLAEWATPLLSDPLFPGIPGKLIDIVPDAGCGQTNALINPIDNTTCITVDALGNPRVDANDARDTGAVQLGLAPNLSLTETGDGFVGLKWIEPSHHDGLDISGYEIRYFETGSPGSTSSILVDPPALTKTVDSLTNGTEYSFEVRAIYDGLSGPENGPFSNQVTATPYAGIATPDVTAIPGDREVALSWPLPDLGGRTFEYFTIQWRIAGTTDYTDALVISNPGTTTTTITGLKNGTTYEFAVVVKASGEVSEPGLATATPHGDIGTVDRNPTFSQRATSKENKPRYWEREPYSFGDCTKYEVADDFGSVWDLVGDASALILKSDRINDVWFNPIDGLYGTASAKDISHAIVCYDQP